jgi:cytochrome c oxidase subunit II
MRTVAAFLPVLAVIAGCSTIQQFPAIPATLDRAAVPTDTVDVTARRYVFQPDVIHVKAGTLLVLRLTAVDCTHGIEMLAFDIDEHLEKGVTKLIEVYIPQPGAYDFKCSYYCGVGCGAMNGQILAE